MVEGIRPELDIKVCASKERSNRIREGPVNSIYRLILKRGLTTSSSDLIAFGSEQVLNGGIVKEFSALIHM